MRQKPPTQERINQKRMLKPKKVTTKPTRKSIKRKDTRTTMMEDSNLDQEAETPQRDLDQDLQEKMEHVSDVVIKVIKGLTASDFPNQATHTAPSASRKASSYFTTRFIVTDRQDQVTDHQHQKQESKESTT